ncbi:hypothetical protein GT039_34920, partial [Streptomyces sp. SID2955]|nr:hypothetical protein [Streptomyces sp. SID2955]
GLPGETVDAQVRVPARALSHWDVTSGGWRTEPGPYRLLAGPSVGELPLTLGVLAVDGRREASDAD